MPAARVPFYALWSLEAEQTVTLPAAGDAEEVDLMGGRRPLKAASGRVRVRLRPLRPTFVVMESPRGVTMGRSLSTKRGFRG